MSKATISILVFGIYLVLLSAILILAPNVLLWFFGIPPTNEVGFASRGCLLSFSASTTSRPRDLTLCPSIVGRSWRGQASSSSS